MKKLYMENGIELGDCIEARFCADKKLVVLQKKY